MTRLSSELDLSDAKKVFILFEAPATASLYEINTIAQEFRNKNEECEMLFGIPVVPEVDEIKINVFYESNL